MQALAIGELLLGVFLLLLQKGRVYKWYTNLHEQASTRKLKSIGRVYILIHVTVSKHWEKLEIFSNVHAFSTVNLQFKRINERAFDTF